MDKNPQEVAAMFDGVARRYDIVNDILSLGRTKAWRKAATKIIAPRVRARARLLWLPPGQM